MERSMSCATGDAMNLALEGIISAVIAASSMATGGLAPTTIHSQENLMTMKHQGLKGLTTKASASTSGDEGAGDGLKSAR